MTGAGTGRRGAEGAVDASVVLLLVALTLTILDDSYSDRSYLVAGLVPAVALLTLALLLRGRHEGGWWYALGATLSFAPLGALFALRQPGPYAVPTLESMNRVLGETFGAPGVLVSTVPPADAAGQVMLVPFVIGFFAAGFSAWLALGTRSPIAPTVPLVLAMAGTIPLGVLEPTLLVPRGMLIALVLVVWVSARARRRESLVGRARGSLATTATALGIVAVVSLGANVVVPDRETDDRVLLRGSGDSDLASGAAASALPPQVGRHRQLFRATGVPEGRRLRFAVLDRYDGYFWAPADVSPGTDGFGTFKRIGSDITAARDGQEIEVHIQVRPGYSGDWLPLLGDLTSLDLEEFDGRTQLEDVRYNPATSSALVIGGVDPRDDYTFTSVLVDDGLTGDDRAADATADQRQPAGAYLDEYLKPFERTELTRLQRVLLLARYLRTHGATRFTGPSLQGPDDLGRDMLGSRDLTGTPFQYAALMALGASRLGVPGRVVTGAAPGRRGLVEHQDVGVWVELQLADGAWRTLEPRRYVGAELISEDEPDGPVDDVGGFVGDLFDGASGGGGDSGGGAGSTERPPPTPSDGADDDDEEADAQASPSQVVLRLIGALGAAALLVVVLVPGAKVVRRRRRRSSGGWSGPYVNGWQEVLDVARDLGTPVPESWSRVAQARQLGAGIDLARQADAAVFAPGPGDGREDGEFWDACLALRSELVAEADARRRWWAPFNPASLLASWARRRTGRSSGRRQVRHEDRGAGGQQPTRA